MITNQQQIALAIWAAGVVFHLFTAGVATSYKEANPVRFLAAIVVSLIWPLTFPFLLGMLYNPANKKVIK